MIDQEQWIVVHLGTTLISMCKEEWEKLNQKERSVI